MGVISYHFRDHTIGRLNLGWMRGLDRDRFELTVFRFGPAADDLATEIDDAADKVVTLPFRLDVARQTISAESLDALIYTDLGMEPMTYFLAFSRLALVQCVMWGHPVTTGIQTIDYFLSGSELEPAEADRHYTERLVRLPGLPTFYYRPKHVAPASRDDFGWRTDRNIYLCPQSLFKLQPDFDAVLSGILQADPRGQLVLVDGEQSRWRELLLERFRYYDPKMVSQISFLPRMQRPQFLRMLATADVMLDPLHFSGGNTTYEALAFGTPIVTLPGEFMRGRVTAACYRRMQLDDCLANDAEDYVTRAVRLGTDRAYRAAVSERILAANSVVYEDQSMIRGLEDFLMSASQRARNENG